MDLTLEAFGLLLALLGTTLLAREVDKGRRVEELNHELTMARELAALYRTDVREFWIRSYLRTPGTQRRTAEQLASELGEDAIRSAAKEVAVLYGQDVPQALDRWDNVTNPAVLNQRRRMLWVGYWLLIAGFAVEFIARLGHDQGFW